MKLALIIPNNLWVSPYVQIYARQLDKIGINYETISWNRDGRIENGIQYDYQPKNRNPFVLIWAYLRYASFVKKIVRKNGYDRLIVFTPQSAIFLANFLERNFKGKYIFDYRDLSLEQKPYFKKVFLKVLRNSFANVISSPGFKKYLPKGFDYIISHNFNVDIVKKTIDANTIPTINKENVSVLTIGAIRTDMNPEVIDALGDKAGVSLSFVGKGPASQYLENYVKEIGYQNISFKGFYNKEEEASIIEKFNFINIFYPQVPSHITAVSNRFYNSLIYKRPMLVTKNSTQGDYADKNGVGLTIENCDNLAENMKDYLVNLDYPKYCENCNKLLMELMKDYEKWFTMLQNFIS